MKNEILEYNSFISQLFPNYIGNGEEIKKVKTFTFQVTEDCCLRCSYCYQGLKTKNKMTWEVAKKAVDYLFDNAEDENFAFSYKTTQGIIIDFIGGEPLLEIDLIVQIMDYFEYKLFETNSPWLLFHRFSFSSNGVLYFEPKVQEMLKKYWKVTSFSITVDGNKELHDECRLFPDGTGSYEVALSAAIHARDNYDMDGTKVTLSPYNIEHMTEAVINMIEVGFTNIHINCVYEEGWEKKHALIFYEEIKKLTDWLIENDKEEDVWIALFEKYCGLDTIEDKNYCGGTGEMLAVNYEGNFFPCIRYMENSLNGDQVPYCIGNCDGGLGCSELYKERIEFLDSITMTSQSSNECIECPIASGCGWCSGYNYQKTGSANNRVTFICDMHKARILGATYFYKKCNSKTGLHQDYKNNMNEKIALSIIDKQEWDYLNTL